MAAIKLPICNPLVRGYLHHAYQLSILGNYEKAKPWIFMNYIQLVSETGLSPFPVQFYLPDGQGYNWSILSPCFEYQFVTRDFIMRHGLDVLDIVRDAIGSGYYVYTYVNERHIPGKDAHVKGRDFNHMMMLHGMDDEEGLVFFWGYAQGGAYVEGSATFEQWRQAYLDNRHHFALFEDRLYLLKMREDEGFVLKLDLASVIQDLTCLRDAKQVARNVLDCHEQMPCVYGLDVYDKLVSSHRNTNDHWCTLRSLHLLMEHKQVMVERLRYIQSLYPRPDLSRFASRYGELGKELQILRNLVLKSSMTGNPFHAGKLEAALNRIREKEHRELTQLIDALAAAV